ncbi:MAG: TatD DNase family protein, partial [Candidatus Omnitrophota bacterium]
WPRKDAPPGVLHCFTGSLPFARELVDMGFMISFSGILTFKNAAALREVAETVPDDRLLIETDSPYLAPVPYRGKRNEPAYVVEVARLLAELRGTDIETIAALTTANALRFFSL